MQSQHTPRTASTNQLTRRDLLKAGAAAAVAAPLASMPFPDTAAALQSPSVIDAVGTSSTDVASGVPIVGYQDPWALVDTTKYPILEVIANVAAWRVGQPVHAVRSDIEREMSDIAKAHLPERAHARYRELEMLLDSLEIPQIEFMIAVVARVLPHVDVKHGTFEDVLQAAFASAGVTDLETADELARSMFVDFPSLAADVQECYPDFDPGQLSIMKREAGLYDRRLKAV